MIDPYKVLGLKKDCSQDEIKKAYKKLAMKYHPDKNAGNKEAEEQFKKINEAYQMIGSKESREQYDHGGMDQEYFKQHGFGGHGGGGFRFSFEDLDNDIFDSIFGFQGRQGGPYARANLKGEDHHFNMTIDFATSILGGVRNVSLPSGKNLEVKIPAGITSGKKLRFKGQGGPGMGKGPSGDLYIQLEVASDKAYTRKKDNLYKDIDVPLVTAVLGGVVNVKTLEGNVELNIPPHTNSGKKFRIKGKGVKGQGDLIVKVAIQLPADPDEHLANAIKNWSQESVQ